MGDEDVRGRDYYPNYKPQRRKTMKEIKSEFNKYQQKLYSKRKG